MADHIMKTTAIFVGTKKSLTPYVGNTRRRHESKSCAMPVIPISVGMSRLPRTHLFVLLRLRPFFS